MQMLVNTPAFQTFSPQKITRHNIHSDTLSPKKESSLVGRVFTRNEVGDEVEFFDVHLCIVIQFTAMNFMVKESRELDGQRKLQWLFLVPLKGGRWHIIPQLAVYTTYILPSGGLYATYHPLGEPETTIENLKLLF